MPKDRVTFLPRSARSWQGNGFGHASATYYVYVDKKGVGVLEETSMGWSIRPMETWPGWVPFRCPTSSKFEDLKRYARVRPNDLLRHMTKPAEGA